jgi:hypothetical protein
MPDALGVAALDATAARRWCAAGQIVLRGHQREIDSRTVHPVLTPAARLTARRPFVQTQVYDVSQPHSLLVVAVE